MAAVLVAAFVRQRGWCSRADWAVVWNMSCNDIAVCPLPQARSISCEPKPRRALATRTATEPAPPFLRPNSIAAVPDQAVLGVHLLPHQAVGHHLQPGAGKQGQEHCCLDCLTGKEVWVVTSPQVQVALHAGERGHLSLLCHALMSCCGLKGRFESQLASRGKGTAVCFTVPATTCSGLTRPDCLGGCLEMALCAASRPMWQRCAGSPPHPQRADDQSHHMSLSCKHPQPVFSPLCVLPLRW